MYKCSGSGGGGGGDELYGYDDGDYLSGGSYENSNNEGSTSGNGGTESDKT